MVKLDPVSTFLNGLPSGWLKLPLKRCVATKITDGPHETPELVDDGIPFVSAEAVQDGRIDFDRKRGFIRPELHAQYIRKCRPRRDDVFLCKSGATTGKLAYVDTDIEFSIWSPLALIRADQSRVLPRFLYMVLHANYMQDQVKTTWSYGTQPNIAMGVIEQLLLAVPPLPLQQMILTFLDRKTTQIDALIAKKQRMIELLGEKRQALISHAVTKGLDPNMPMKDSGIEWLGEIPKHWDVAALKRHWLVTDCKHRTVPFVDDGIPVASIGEVQDLTIDLSRAKKTVRPEFVELVDGDRKPTREDIIYSRNATVGAAALVDTDEEFCMGQDVCLISSARQNQEFLVFQLRSPVVMRQLDAFMVGATFKRINVGQIKELLVCRPPVIEQTAIARYCWRVHRGMLSTVERLIRQITKLQEYRQTLISAAVTGKIDVR